MFEYYQEVEYNPPHYEYAYILWQYKKDEKIHSLIQSSELKVKEMIPLLS